MESATIAKFVSVFNANAVSISALFAICGVLALIGKRYGANIFRGNIFFKAFCIASVVAFVAELTFFNFQHYLKFFAGPELSTTEPSSAEPNIVLTTDDGVRAELVPGGIVFKNLNRKVATVFANVVFNDNETAEMSVWWTDEECTRGYKKTIYKHLPHENHTLTFSSGKVSKLGVSFETFSSSPVDLISVAVNKPAPFNFNGLRLLAVSLLFFALFILLHKGLRARVAFYLFEYKFDPANRTQNIIYASMVVLLMLFSWVCIYTTPNSIFITGLIPEQYNKYLVDALMQGRTWLDWGNPEKLLTAERPYDTDWLIANGYKQNVDWVLDWVWYNGKWYSYYGIVPAVLVFLPYKMITGSYLSFYGGMFLFALAAVSLLAMLWRFCVKKYMPDVRFVFYLLSFLALFFAGGMFCVMRFPSVYTVSQITGLLFTIAGVLFLLKSIENERINKLKLFFACLCFALVVGCRPNMIFTSLFVPIVLWKYRTWKLAVFVLIPFILVAIPLCIYNHARFDSIFSFGQRLWIAGAGMQAYDSVNPLMKVFRVFTCAASYLFLPNTYTLHFPFVTLSHLPFTESYTQPGGGVINFPIVFCLFYFFVNIFRKSKFQTFNIASAFLAIAVIMVAVLSLINGFIGRYAADFAIFFILPSLFCAYYWCNDRDSVHQTQTRMKVTYALLAASIFVGMFLFVTGGNISNQSPRDPVLYRYLECALGVIRNF